MTPNAAPMLAPNEVRGVSVTMARIASLSPNIEACF
jgi:hypothetical protein